MAFLHILGRIFKADLKRLNEYSDPYGLFETQRGAFGKSFSHMARMAQDNEFLLFLHSLKVLDCREECTDEPHKPLTLCKVNGMKDSSPCYMDDDFEKIHEKVW